MIFFFPNKPVKRIMSTAIYRPYGISMMSTFPTIQDLKVEGGKIGGGKCIYELTIIQDKIKKKLKKT